MTSDTHQVQGQEDHGGLAMNASGQSEQATMSLAAGQIAERSKPLFRFPNAVSLRAKGSPRPSLSTGHIPSEAEATAVESSVDESGTDEPACTEPSKQFQSFCTDSDLAQGWPIASGNCSTPRSASVSSSGASTRPYASTPPTVRSASRLPLATKPDMAAFCCRFDGNGDEKKARHRPGFSIRRCYLSCNQIGA